MSDRIDEIRARLNDPAYTHAYPWRGDISYLLSALDERTRERDEAIAQRDARPAITAEDAANLLRWMLSAQAETCVEYPTPHWVDRVVDAASAHAAKANGGDR